MSDQPEAGRRPTHDHEAALTYSSYLNIDELLSLQQPRSAGPEHDEMLFIIIHQVYELWFKELLHEFDAVMRLLEDDESHRAQHTLKRILTILKVMVAQLDLDEGVQEWRYRHVKMVERTIGTKRGTGGSLGAAYLQETVGRPIFPDLWAIRSQL